jgi:hypothetical protein
MFDDFNGTGGRHRSHPPGFRGSSVSESALESSTECIICDERNFASQIVNSASTQPVTINMQLAAEGAAMLKRERLQHIEDLIADALWDHENGAMSHRRQAEAVLATLLSRGLNPLSLDLS